MYVLIFIEKRTIRQKTVKVNVRGPLTWFSRLFFKTEGLFTKDCYTRNFACFFKILHLVLYYQEQNFENSLKVTLILF